MDGFKIGDKVVVDTGNWVGSKKGEIISINKETEQEKRCILVRFPGNGSQWFPKNFLIPAMN